MKVKRLVAGAGIGILAGLAGNSALADQVFADDVIVQGSLCVGFDCILNEVFSFNTIKLKENNTRIGFDDTSVGTFPANDWELTANNSASGGLNQFSITDVTGTKVPFLVEAGATTNALYVDSSGNVGLGTSSPVLDLQVTTGNTPAVRLEQDGSGGFTAQTWDIAGNEANFFIRDVTGGSRLPFRIRPGAPTSTIDISAAGNVGIGTSSPSTNLHVATTDNDPATLPLGLFENTSATSAVRRMLELKNNGGLFIAMTNNTAGVRWNLVSENNAPNRFVINDAADATNEFVLDAAGNVSISGKITTVGGSCGAGCDRVFGPDYTMLSIEDHAKLMWENQFLPNVGPTPEGAPIDLSDKLGRMLNELEHAHIYIAELHDQMQQDQAVMAAMQARLSELEGKLLPQE